ncbi:uncharacterized protein LOC134238205 [Saccostrea cucullata]|uniref:uncharacterized protein LOC134238205 n=1 Tax=Saccostrea cuccullata TaxID=36930 RepID=UPI002ECFB5D7
MDIYIQRACIRMDNRYYVSSSKLQKIIFSTLSVNFTPHGPCATRTIGTLEFDSAPCFICDFWPPSASSWIERSHSWPQRHVVNDIVNNGCHLVAIGHKLGIHEDHEWRISFSRAEQKLVYAMNHCQFLTYGLLKLFLSEIINNGLHEDDKLLCSYHMKTAIFWVIQQNTIPHWCPQNLLEGFWVCFKLILKWVYEGVCPNFFIPDNNMFLSKIYGNKQHKLFIRLYGLYEKRLEFLLHSPSIRLCILDVLLNPILLYICTDEHTLISEAEFDINLFHEINNYYAINFDQLNLQRYAKYMHTIEQIIDLPLLTKYRDIMLQKLTADVLQQFAFSLHMETYTHENKLRSRANKLSCHMLKLTAKFGCITDMLYIAMYYYKTHRYMKALYIIEIVKVKLAQPYLMYESKVDTKMYIEAVGGQSWCIKMKQTVAWNIGLENIIHYINELIPEQQFAYQNNHPKLIVPPFILLYMLEILCYRHVDTMRVQTALEDLQTLVHYDQGELIDLEQRDISWQILGICQQVTGNFQAALYSYQQSLRQEPNNDIQKATEMRRNEILNEFRKNSREYWSKSFALKTPSKGLDGKEPEKRSENVGMCLDKYKSKVVDQIQDTTKGRSRVPTLVDGCQRNCDEAMVDLKTSYVTGKVYALVLDSPFADVIIGNNVSILKPMEDGKEVRMEGDDENTCVSVQTRLQTEFEHGNSSFQKKSKR